MSIEQSLIRLAVSDADINDLIDGRVSFNEAHEITKTPYITIETTSSSAESLLGSDTNIIREFVQLNLYSKTKQEQSALIRAVLTRFVRLKNYTDLSGTIILNTELVDQTDLTNNLDLNLFYRAIDIEFVYRDL